MHYCQTFRESNSYSLLNILLKSWFDEIFFWWERISLHWMLFSRNIFQVIGTQCGNFGKFPPTEKFFRQIDLQTCKLQYNSLVKTLIWRNFCKENVGGGGPGGGGGGGGGICKFPHCEEKIFRTKGR